MDRNKLTDDEVNLELKLTAFRKKVEDDKKKKLKIEAAKEEIIKEKGYLFASFSQTVREAGFFSTKYFFPLGIVNIFVFKSIFILPLTYSAGFLCYFMPQKVNFS